MDILVLVKRVPETADADLSIDAGGRALDADDLSFATNEWDDFAVEEAVRLKEAHGGTVTALTLGDEDAEEVLRRALAMGADEALHLQDEAFDGSDPQVLAKILAAALEGRSFDLILSGAIASDTGSGQIGGLLAGFRDLPFVALATKIEVGDGKIEVQHEVEGGLERIVEVDLPAVVSVQTGINEPRYVSIRGIRKVAAVDIPVSDAAKLGLDASAVGLEASALRLEALEPPPTGGGAEILEGDAETVAAQLVEKLRERGGF